MMDVQPAFWDFVTLDGDGFIDGIRDDAPDEAKKAFEEYQKYQHELELTNEKI